MSDQRIREGLADAAPPPEVFVAAVESMHQATVRPEITIGTIRPPQKLARFSHAVGLEVSRPTTGVIATDASGDAFGRVIALYEPAEDPASVLSRGAATPLLPGLMRLVLYIQADMEREVAADPMLPEVAWQWLQEGLARAGANFEQLGGTVTTTASERFGTLSGPSQAYQIEMRASWTALSSDLSPHVTAVSHVLAAVAGLLPEGVSALPQLGAKP